MKQVPCTRLAPSPTGPLHLGNARTFLLNWAIARRNGWKVVFRHEDLDPERVPDGGHEAVESILKWLGLDWDGEPLRQRDDLAPYREAMNTLEGQGRIFSCGLSRGEIRRAANAPHAADDGPSYPPSLRPEDPAAWTFKDTETNYRFKVEPGVETIEDVVAGTHQIDPAADAGDFVVWTRAGMPSYQLAVVVDDARQGVTEVFRGDDLLPSTARQLVLGRALGLAAPRYWHVPLVHGPDGQRLAKRHGGAELDTFRQEGVPPERVIGLLAAWSGIIPEPRPLSAHAIIDQIDEDVLKNMSQRESRDGGRRIHSPEDQAWLNETS